MTRRPSIRSVAAAGFAAATALVSAAPEATALEFNGYLQAAVAMRTQSSIVHTSVSTSSVSPSGGCSRSLWRRVALWRVPRFWVHR